MSSLKGYRTFIVALLTALLGSLEAAGTLPWGDQVTGILVAILGAVLFALRTVTDTAPRKGA